MLEEMGEYLPSLLLFHLKNLYLRFSLCQCVLSNTQVYHHLYNSYTHSLLEHLLQCELSFEQILPYIKGLTNPTEKGNLLGVVASRKLQVCSESYDRFRVAADHVFREAEGLEKRDVLLKYQHAFSASLLKAHKFNEAFELMLDILPPDHLILFGMELSEALTQEDTADHALQMALHLADTLTLRNMKHAFYISAGIDYAI
mmetsp:Transcript_3617/g.3565  ORF Transcript_3617/g.3565 Transcript_3617/m.3565 type:complete len:201 (+) Transcript_3617:799-1401(+)